MSNIFTSVEGGVVGGAAAIGIAAALEPLAEPERQEVWSKNPYRVLDPGTLARLVAQALTNYGDAADQATRSGIDTNKFAALVQLGLVAPDVAEAMSMHRREEITTDQLHHTYAKAQIEEQYWTALDGLLDDRLSPEVIALAIVRGIMTDPGFLPVPPPTGTGKVPAFPVSPLDSLKEAKAAGWNAERLFVQTAISGRPIGPESAAAATFRGIIEPTDYERAIAEGDVRNEWAQAIFETARQIATANDYVQAHLRGWITYDEMLAGAKRHGMEEADTRLLYLRAGRPITVRQILVGLRRGGVYDAPLADTPEPYRKAVQESDIRPEWTNLLYEGRETYPSAFVVRRLVSEGTLTADEGYDVLYKAGWNVDLARKAADSWAAPTATGGPNYTGRAQTQLWTQTHRSYVNGETSENDARAKLTALGTTGAERNDVIALWKAERELVRKQLTAAQIKKAYAEPVRNPATGVNWTLDDALAALIERGYSPNDAATFLEL